MPKIGDVIGRFTLEQGLGRGPMSEVYLGVERATGWKVAFKLFVMEPGAKPDDRTAWAQRMVREARAAATFRHENVVRVHEIGELARGPYLVRDFIEGQSLAEYVTDTSSARGTREWKVHWLVELARALADIHRAGLVHRDVKPSNVLIRRDGALRILDFGVARRSVDRAAGIRGPTSNRIPGAPPVRVLGTPAYMAPERLGNQGGGPAADQFGWGVLAYELLSGRLPWAGGGDAVPVKIIEAILTQTPASIRAHAPDLPPALDPLLARAMAKLPGDRFPNMDDLVCAFDDLFR